MDDIDILQLIEGAETYSTSVKVVKRTDSVIKAGGAIITESSTIIESISFSQRTLKTEDIIEDYIDDLTWLL